MGWSDMTLHKKVLFITGASRGIGMAIALRAARDGACIAIVAKTTEPHPTLKGTIHTAAEAVKAAGGEALPIACDIRANVSRIFSSHPIHTFSTCRRRCLSLFTCWAPRRRMPKARWP